MSQNNQRKHYHIHAPYQHPHQQQQQQQQQQQAQLHHHHHLTAPSHSQQHQHNLQQQHQWYSQQHYQQHGLHVRDSRHLPHHPPSPQQPPPAHHNQTMSPHMFTSGYVGMSQSGTGAGGGSSSATHNASALGSTHNMPAATAASSSAHHYSSSSSSATSASNVNSNNAASNAASSSSAAGAFATSRNRMFDLEMLPTQQHSQHNSTTTAAHSHSMLAATNNRTAFDAYSHNSLYSQQNQRHHSATASSHYPLASGGHHPAHHAHHHIPPSHHQPHSSSLHHQQQQHHQLHQQPQHHYYHHRAPTTSLHRPHSQVLAPMLQHIKSEPVEQITVTPSIQTEEVIIKSEPIDDTGYHQHKSAPQMENNSFHMEEKRKQYELQQHQQQQRQQQQQQQHQQREREIQQQQRLQQQLQEQQRHQREQQQQQRQQQHQQQQELHQHQQLQIKQEPHDYPTHLHHHHDRQSKHHQHNEDVTQQTQQQSHINSENSTAIQPAEKNQQEQNQQKQQEKPEQQQKQEQQQLLSLTNIKTEAKPLNFPRRKLQTERSSTLPICQRCKQVFLKRQNYTQHVALSSCNIVEYDFKCSVCPMSFMSNEELQTHEQLHRSHRYFCQKYCGKFYETIDECEQHEYGQHEYEMYKCNICCISVTQREQLFTHLNEHKYQPRFDCCICRLCFQTSLELHDHYMTNEDFCGKFYDKEAFKKTITSLSKTYLGKPESSKLEIAHTFSLKDIPSANSQQLEPLYTKPSTSKSYMEPPTTPTTPSFKNFSSNEFPLEPHVEVKTEIKVEPDFYPPMDQSDFPSYDNDYSSSDYTSGSNQSLAFLHDFHDNASSSTNSSYSHNANDAIQDDEAICCVPKCGVRKFSSPSLQFFGFPRDEKYLAQWLHNLKMVYDPNINYGIYRICSLHFPKRCIAKYSLSYWAVPTFNLGHDDVGNLYQNRESSGGFPAGDLAKCSMPNCPSQRGETNVKFHVFPRDLKTLIKWCQNSRLPVHSKDNRFFCSRHFEEKCFGKFRLKPWAIPTLNLGTVYGKIHDNPNIYQEEKKCFLPFCRRSRSYDCNLSLYRFPRDETLLRRWCYNLRLDPNMYRGKNHKICSSHFIKEALGLRKLNPGAVPTLNLGHNDRFNIYENELYTPPPPPPPPQPSTSSKAQKYAERFKQEMGGSHIYDGVFMNSMVHKFSSSSSSASNNSNNLDLGDVCLVPSCKRTRHSSDITLHTVPKRAEQLKKWCHNLKMDLHKMHKSVRICSAHFEKYCIGGCMRPFAVPTLELGHDDSNIYRNPDVIKKLNIRETCCVQTCKRNRDRDHANLHRFPTHPELLQKWCENLQKPIPDGTKLFNDAVCEMHFEDRCLRNKRLEKWAIPTLNLGWDEAPHILPSEEEVNENWVKPFAPNNGDEQGECCVSSCKRNPQIDDIKLYRPPEDAEQLVKWAHNLQVDVTELPNMKICNLHFEQHCIGKRLLNWAMPTLNLGGKVEHLFENPPPMPTIYRKKIKPERILSNHEAIKWSPRCCLPHCRKMRTVDKVHLFRFPYNHRQTLAKWCHNLQLPLVGSSHRRICSSHFEPSVLTKRCPMSLAVPTLDLNPPTGYKIYQNPARLKQIKPGTQRQCIIESCRKTKMDGVSLYRFPNNRSILLKWRHNIKNWPKGKLSNQLRICAEHFETHSVGEKKLSPGAIPTLKLGHDSKDLYANETRSFFDLEKCVVNGCDSRKEMEDIRLFRFPRDDDELLKKWCHNLKMNPNDCVGIKICSKHFENDCLGPRQLYKWCIPTLKLGYAEDDLVEIIPNPPPEQRTGEYLFKCCVPNCGKTRKYDDAQMNSFPKHLKMFRKWKHNLKLDFLNFKEREKYKICNDHFEAVCVGKTRLNFGALPTLNLGHDDTDDLYQINPERIRPNLFIRQKDVEILERRRILRHEKQEQYECEEPEEDPVNDPLGLEPGDMKCVVDDCPAPKSIMREPYDLPETSELNKLWLKELGKNDEDGIPSEAKVCGLHFQMTYIKLKNQMLELSEDNSLIQADVNKLQLNYQKSNISLVVNSYQCRVNDCPTNLLNSSIRLYYFPYGKHLISKWSQNTGITPDEHRRYMNKVCALHFETYCITENQRLRSWAIPTLNLPPSEGKHLNKNPDLTKLDRRMLGPPVWKCAVTNCNSLKSGDDDSIKLFNFPSEDKLLKKWCDNLKISHHFTPLMKICSLHFEKLCFGSSRIRSWAIPTLNLGHDNTPEHFNKTTIRQEVYDQNEEVEATQLKQVKIKKSLDTAKCFVACCRKSRLKHGVRFYSLPSNSRVKRKWLHNLQISQLKSKHKLQNIKICNLHFHKRCLDGKILKPWAVPTMHLDYTEGIFDNPRRMQSLPILRCVLAHCNNHTGLKGVRLFVFPKSPEFLKKWSKNLKLDLEKCKGRICQEHFENEVIGEKKLKNGAVPTLNLGHEDDDIYDNSELMEKLKIKKIEKELKQDPLETKNEEDCDEEYEPLDGEEVEEEEEMWETDIEEEEEGEEDEDQTYFDDEEERENAAKQEEPQEDDESSVTNSVKDWSSVKFKELRVSITPLTPEDLMDLCSRSSYEREFGSLTPASSLRGRRSVTPASSWKDLRSETPEQKPFPIFGFKSRSDTNDEKPFNCFRQPSSVTPDQKTDNVRETQSPEEKSNNLNRNVVSSNSSDLIKEVKPNILKRECTETNNEGIKRERVDISEDETSSNSLSNEKYSNTSTNLRTDKALNSVAPMCCLKHCGKEKTPEQHLTTYGFPKDPHLLQKWCENLGLQTDQCIGRVCIDHFELRVIGTRRLKQGAVPTLNLGPNRMAKHNNVDETPQQRKNVTKELGETAHMQEADSNLKAPPPYKTPKPAKQSVFRLCCLKHCRRKKFVKPEKIEELTHQKMKMENMELLKEEKMEQRRSILFKFPKDELTLKKWYRNLRLPEKLQITPDLQICARHFEPKVIKDGKLKPMAVPTLELSYACRAPIYLNVENEILNDNIISKNEVMETCFLKHCGNIATDEIFLLSFPENQPLTLKRWCKNLQLSFGKNEFKDLKICSEHFESYAFCRKRLKTGALPTLNLGHNETIIRNSRKLRRQRVNNNNAKEKCCLKQCGESTLKLYAFPRSSELRKIWCNNLQIELREAMSNHYKLCARHFSLESFIVGSDNLKLNAVPVLNLGKESEKHLLLNHEAASESKCLVENCQKTPSVDRVKLFNFPEKPDILKKWLFNLNLTPKTLNSNDVICSKHFENTCIRNGIMHENAIPTKFLTLSNKDWFYQNNEELFEISRKCCVLECGQNSEEAKHLYRFPKHKEDLEKWLYNLKLQVDEAEVKDLRVCERHFEQSCKISNKDLITQALPTLNLGHNDTDIYGNYFIKCCLDACDTEGFYFHKLPEDLMLRSFWFQELEMEGTFNSSLYICSVHFVAFFERILEKYSVFLKESKEYIKLSVTYNELKALNNLQSYKCFIPKCNSGFKLIWKLFKFPKDLGMFNKWQHNTGLQFEYEQRNSYRICAQHFEERCLSKFELHRWSLPTLKLPFNNSLYVNPPEALPSNHENLQHCCVAECSNKKGPFYKFPIRPLDIKKWIHNLDLGSQQSTLNLRVCYKHFENYCFSKAVDKVKPLKFWSVPTLKLKRRSQLYLNPADKIAFYVCSLPNCRQILNKSKNIYLYKFPLSNTWRQKWLHNLSLKPHEYQETMRICSTHFEKSCFYKDLIKIKKKIVPTLNLNNPPKDIYKNLPQCCAKLCHNNRSQLFSFPKNKTLLKKWCNNLQLEGDLDKETLRDWKLCTKHFEKRCINKFGALRSLAVPTLNLGHQGRRIFKNPNFGNIKKVVVKKENGRKDDEVSEEEITNSKGTENDLVKKSKHFLNKDQAVTVIRSQRLKAKKLNQSSKNDNNEIQESLETNEERYDTSNIEDHPYLGNLFEILTQNHSEKETTHVMEALKQEHAEEKFNIPKNPTTDIKLKHENSSSLLKDAANFKPEDFSELNEISQAEEKNVFTVYDVSQETPNSNDSLDYKEYPHQEHYQHSTHSQEFYLEERTGYEPSEQSEQEFEDVGQDQKCEESLTNISQSLPRCCIKSCSNYNNYRDHIPLYKFPRTSFLRQHWLQNCNFTRCSAKNYRICMEHFDKECFRDRTRLLFGAVPTEKLKGTFDFKELLESHRQSRCLVESCQRSSQHDRVRRIPFPSGPLLDKWRLKLKLNQRHITEEDWICHRHFERKTLTDGFKLKKDSVPTLLLPKEALKKCWVQYCSNSEAKLFKIPLKDELLFRKWLRILNLQDTRLVRNQCHVCIRHFERKWLDKGYLKPQGFPSLYLKRRELAKVQKLKTKTEELKNISKTKKRVKPKNCIYGLCKLVGAYNWSNEGIFAQIWLEEKQSLEVSKTQNLISNENEEEYLKLCDEHFYYLYKSNEKVICDPESHKGLEDIRHEMKQLFEYLNSLEKFYTKKCVVPQCFVDQHLAQNYKSLKLFGFPKSPEICKKWCHNVEIEYKSLKSKPLQKVCELHFEDYCLSKRILLNWAVPTLNLPQKKSHFIIPNDPDEVFVLKGRCCIKACINAYGLDDKTNSRFYRFPQESARLEKWLELTHIEDFEENVTQICGLHFDPKDFLNKNRELKEDALPRYNLDPETPDASVLDDLIEVKQELDNSEEWCDQDNIINENLENFDIPKCKEISKESDIYTQIEIKQEVIEIQEEEAVELTNCSRKSLETSELHKTNFYEENLDFRKKISKELHLSSEMDIKQEILEEPFEVPSSSQSTLFTIEKLEISTEFGTSINNPESSFVITDVKSQIYLCCVQKCCNNSETPGIQFFTQFPQDSEIFIKWCFNLKIDPRHYQENQYAICQQHFEPICFDSTTNELHSWSVPTLNLNLNENSFIHQNDIPEHLKSTSEQCIVYGCIHPVLPLFRFPHSPEMAQKWFSNLRLDYTDFRAQNYRICKRHFPAVSFDMNDLNKLKSEAVPTLYLGHTDKIVYFNSLDERPLDVAEAGGNHDNSRGSSQGSFNRIISPHNLEDHDSSYFEDFEEYYGQDD